MEDFVFEYIHHTHNAICVSDGDDDFWIPFSVCGDIEPDVEDLNEGDTVKMEVARWFAEKEGLF